LEGTTNVVCIDKPGAECGGEVVGIQAEKCWGQNRALRKSIHLPAPRADIVPHVDPDDSKNSPTGVNYSNITGSTIR